MTSIVEQMNGLDVNHPLFVRLQNVPPKWWNNLKMDKDLYIDIRKENHLNVYYNGGSIMKLNWAKDFRASIHSEYVPLEFGATYHKFSFDNDQIALSDAKVLDIQNFSESSLGKIKKRVNDFYSNDSEKGMQARYVIENQNPPVSSGFFLDTEFQFNFPDGKLKGRVDLVWVDIDTKQIALVELKTMADARLVGFRYNDPESIDIQLEKYRIFAEAHRVDLVAYYKKVFKIKSNLGLLPSSIKATSLDDYSLIPMPVLLVGDCTQKWIDANADDINKQLSGIASWCIYQGDTSFNFKLPQKSVRNTYRL